MTDIAHHLLVLFLVVVMPIWDRRETRYLKTTTDPHARTRSYRRTIAWQLAATALLLVTTGPAALYRAPLEGSTMLPFDSRLGIAMAVAMTFGALLPALIATRRPDVAAGQREQLEPVSFFLPRTSEERGWFALLCVVVGLCEEVIFRGFLVRYFLELPWGLGILAATLLAALIFGIDHGYQGWRGIVATGILAIMFTLLFFATGSLLLPVLVHIVIDLRILLILPRQDI